MYTYGIYLDISGTVYSLFNWDAPRSWSLSAAEHRALGELGGLRLALSLPCVRLLRLMGTRHPATHSPCGTKATQPMDLFLLPPCECCPFIQLQLFFFQIPMDPSTFSASVWGIIYYNLIIWNVQYLQFTIVYSNLQEFWRLIHYNSLQLYDYLL